MILSFISRPFRSPSRCMAVVKRFLARKSRYCIPLLLPSLRDQFRDSSSIWATLPVTKYWGDTKRFQELVARGIAKNLAAHGLPAWLAQFDWVVGFGFGHAKKTASPVSIFINGDRLGIFLRYLTVLRSIGLYRPSNESFLVVGNTDLTPTQIGHATFYKAHRYFPRIFHYANDYSLDFVHSYPMAITEHYLRGSEQVLQDLIAHPPKKDTLLLASWGKRWPHLNAAVTDRREATVFVESVDFVQLESLETAHYLNKVSRSHFMLYPQGKGIQSPKGFEAILLGTIPVVTRTRLFEDLSSRGMPLLIVDSWSEISEDMLWRELPALESKLASFHPIARDALLFWDFCFTLPESGSVKK